MTVWGTLRWWFREVIRSEKPTGPHCLLSRTRCGGFRKRLHGAELDGAGHFQKNCQNVPGAAGAAVGAAAASAVCIYYVIIGGRFSSSNSSPSSSRDILAIFWKCLAPSSLAPCSLFQTMVCIMVHNKARANINMVVSVRLWKVSRWVSLHIKTK